MIWIFITFSVLLILLLGPYSLRVVLDKSDESLVVSVGIHHRLNVIGFRWQKEKTTVQYNGLFMNIPLIRIQKSTKKKPFSVEPKETEKKRKVRGRLQFMSRLLGRIPGIVRRLMRCIELNHVRLSGCVGMMNPAALGMTYGLVQSLRPFQNEKMELSLTPCFCTQAFQGQALLVVHFIMVQVLLFVIRSTVEVGIQYLRHTYKRKG